MGLCGASWFHNRLAITDFLKAWNLTTGHGETPRSIVAEIIPVVAEVCVKTHKTINCFFFYIHDNHYFTHARKNVSEMTYSVSSGTQNLNSISRRQPFTHS